ncbi:hypothetical protein HCB18_23875 [Salinispora arenicola]|nr:hypothetical protein [Salinispora arenicola]NIL62898.1 hypothetical protein [Salinispora arenicola]
MLGQIAAAIVRDVPLDKDCGGRVLAEEAGEPAEDLPRGGGIPELCLVRDEADRAVVRQDR